jgi:hypothetical protein
VTNEEAPDRDRLPNPTQKAHAKAIYLPPGNRCSGSPIQTAMKPQKSVSAVFAHGQCLRLRRGGNRVGVIMFVILAMSAAPHLSFGQVQLPAVNLGGSNFEDAFGAPGWLLQQFAEADISHELRDSNGDTIPGRNHVTAYSATSHVVFVSQTPLFGGSIAGEILQPVADLDVQLANRTELRVRGLADLTVGAGVQWAPTKMGDGNFAHRLIFDVSLPTGKYSDSSAANIGNNFVVLNPFYAFTYELEKVEFSARLHYLWNAENHDPFAGFGLRSVQAGQAVHVNYSASYEVRKGVRLGVNGYWLQQVTEDKVNGASVADSLERTVALGLGLQINDRNIWYHLNAYQEFDVRNRPSGAKVIFRVSIAFPNLKV